MNTWIALLRGINVLGHRKLPMVELVETLDGIGLVDVRTYIQSGNVVFRSRHKRAETLRDRIGKAILTSHGFEPQVMVLPITVFSSAVEANPYPTAAAQPKTVHLFFLAAPATEPRLDRIEAMRAGREEYLLTERVFYLHTPDGFGKSRLGSYAERLLGVSATARNWRTVNKILELARQ